MVHIGQDTVHIIQSQQQPGSCVYWLLYCGSVYVTGEEIHARVIGTTQSTLGRIQYTSFSTYNNLVAVCSGFYIVILYVTGGKICGRVIGTTLGSLQYTSFSPNNNLVAVCTGFYIVILYVTGGKICGRVICYRW